MKATSIKNPVKEYGRIEKIQIGLQEKYRTQNKRKKEIEQSLLESWRMTEVTKKVEEMRKKAMRIPEIRSLLARYNLSIEDAAFITFWRERLEGTDRNMFLDYLHRSESLIERSDMNQWEISERYLYGGPQDAVKIIFDESKNMTSCIYGFMAKSPVRLGREKKAA